MKLETRSPVKQETASPQKGGRKKKPEEQQEVWKWYLIFNKNIYLPKIKKKKKINKFHDNNKLIN